MRALDAWRGGLFLTEGKIGVLSVLSIFNTGGSVCGTHGVCVYSHTHTHTAQIGALGCEPRSRDETPGGPEESRSSDRLNLGIHIFVMCTKYTCVYIY